MSRLDSFIRRMSAQRDILNSVSEQSLLPEHGDILELGLGNGRTYNHLREVFPDHQIIAFDRAQMAHASSIPEPGNLILGEIQETANTFRGKNAAMVHVDIGSGDAAMDVITLQWLPGLVSGLLTLNGIAVSGLPLEDSALSALPIPETINKNRYFLYRRVA